MTISAAPVDCHAVIEWALATLRTSFQEKSLIIKTTLTAANPWLHADAMRLRQVFTNRTELAQLCRFLRLADRPQSASKLDQVYAIWRVRAHKAFSSPLSFLLVLEPWAYNALSGAILRPDPLSH